MKTDMENTIYELAQKERYSFDDLKYIMSILRSQNGCPWDREQTHASIRKNFIEETYEVVEAIDTGNQELLKEELGDVLLQVVFHAQIEQEAGHFTTDDVCHDICKKLVIRHPHIFADTVAENSSEVLNNWEEIKNRQKGIKDQSQALTDVPKVLPALMRAAKIQHRAAKTGFDWNNIDDVIAKVAEELEEVQHALRSETADRQAEELGDLLFAVVNLSRKMSCDAEEALSRANEKFILRFKKMEDLAKNEGKDLSEMTLQQMDQLWNRVKQS